MDNVQQAPVEVPAEVTQATPAEAVASVPERKRTVRTKLYALMLDPEGKTEIVEAEAYSELREKLETMESYKLTRIIRGRDIPFKAKSSVKFF